MGAIATFSYATWVARYPEFAAVSEPLAQAYWDEATIYWANNGNGPVTTAAIQGTLLNMLTAHIAALYSPRGDGTQDPGTPVGRISQASEGSVSVSTEADYPPGSPQWFQQTKYGASFWQATATYRTARFFTPVGRVFNPWLNQ